MLGEFAAEDGGSLVDNFYAALGALWFALWSVVLFFVSLYYLQSNLKTWFSFLERRP